MSSEVGISAISLFVPRHRVDLERWCEWTGSPWAKVSAVVGASFRVCSPEQNVYTMAASAVLRLIVDNQVDPRSVGFLALGTESSTDNAAGTVIIKGMVDQGLRALGLASLARDCEVPEFKQACLGGIYATKAAARWLGCEGRGRSAIVVSSDIAEYQRGSSGEPTQGAGAVAFLLESEARLLELDLAHAGSASSYRGFDFRKPVARHFMTEPGRWGGSVRPRDYPVFNGKYSTLCYVDEVVAALGFMFDKAPGQTRLERWAEFASVFMHRPYHQLPVSALATALVVDMASDAAGHAELAELAIAAKVDLQAALDELGHMRSGQFDAFAHAQAHGSDHDPHPALGGLARVFRASPRFVEFQATKLTLGSALAREFGNLYTASLPAWLAAGLADAHARKVDLAGRRLLLIGYGSGDAAEAIPARVVDDWRAQAGTIAIEHALAGAIDLSREAYEQLHDGAAISSEGHAAGFVIERIGQATEAAFQDLGVEYYQHTGGL